MIVVCVYYLTFMLVSDARLFCKNKQENMKNR